MKAEHKSGDVEPVPNTDWFLVETDDHNERSKWEHRDTGEQRWFRWAGASAATGDAGVPLPEFVGATPTASATQPPTVEDYAKGFVAFKDGKKITAEDFYASGEGDAWVILARIQEQLDDIALPRVLHDVLHDAAYVIEDYERRLTAETPLHLNTEEDDLSQPEPCRVCGGEERGQGPLLSCELPAPPCDHCDNTGLEPSKDTKVR